MSYLATDSHWGMPGSCCGSYDATPAIRNMIRENKTHQIINAILTGAKSGMKTMDNSLLELYRYGKISFDELMTYAVDLDYIKKIVSGSIASIK